MELSFSTKLFVVTLLIGMCSVQANARRLYKWVDQESITNYSEFQPKEGTSRKLEVLESRGDEHIDPAMAVTAQMKPIEIPVDQLTPQIDAVNAASQPATSQTVAKQGMIAPAYTPPVSGVVVPSVQKKELSLTPAAPVQEKIVVNPLQEKPASTVAVVEKKEDVVPTVKVHSEKKVKIKVNPWTRTVEAMPSNLVPESLLKVKTTK